MANLTLFSPGDTNSLGDNKDLVIDGIRPTISSFTADKGNGTYGISTNIIITANTSETIKSGNNITVTLNSTSSTLTLEASSNGTTMVGTYTVNENDSTNSWTIRTPPIFPSNP